MEGFISEVNNVVSLMNNWKVIGNISLWQILLGVLAGTVFIKLLKGKK